MIFQFENWSDMQDWNDAERLRLWRRIAAALDGRVTDLR